MAVLENAVTLRVSNADKAEFRELAERLRKSQSETIRLLVRETLAILREKDAKNEQSKNIRAKAGLLSKRMESS